MKRLSLIAIAGAGLAAVVGCTASHATQDNSPVILRIVSVNGEVPLLSDISDAGLVTANVVEVAVANRAKNLQVTTPQVNMAVFMQSYEVVYTRSDGRNVPGVDVPFAISGPLTGVVDVADSGQTLALGIEVVRIQQKLEPPLRNLRAPTPGSPGTTPNTPGGTAIVLTVVAEITVYGETTVGQVVSDSARLQIDFADFGG
jgi:hypothetical protein